MTNPQQQTDPPVHPLAELMSPVTIDIVAAVEGFWSEQTPERVARLLDLWAVGSDVAVIVQRGPHGVTVDIGKPVKVDDAPTLGTGQYL